jgi:hypothetical protein
LTHSFSTIVFESWSEQEIEQATHKIQFQRINLDRIIWKEGDIVDQMQYFPIIKRGEVQVLKSFTSLSKKTISKKDGGKNHTQMMEMCILGPKAVFIERSMLDSDAIEVDHAQTIEANTFCRRGTWQ